MTVTAKPVHPDRYTITSHTRKVGVVVHDAESNDNSAQALCDLMARPGDRPSPNTPGKMYGSSYHAITTNDPHDAPYVQVQGPDHGPFSAPPVNGTWWHVCMPGRANQGATGWADEASQAGIRGVAKFIVDKSSLDGFPLARCSVSDLLAGDGGYCGHVDISQAWHQSDHTDPGPTFPWDQLAVEIVKLTEPQPGPEPQPPTPVPSPEDDAMLTDTTRIVRQKDYLDVFLVDVGHAMPLSSELLDTYGPEVPRKFQNHMPSFRVILARAGMTVADLTPGGPTDHF